MTDTRTYRLTSIDLLRGLVLVIMVLDHARDFVMAGSVQNPMADPHIAPALFVTRWITHFCAPVFVFLAGTSAGLMTTRRSPAELGLFLLKRGAWLVAVEFFIVSTAFTFAPFGTELTGGHIVVGLQVIWAIGVSMIVLAGAQFLGARACLALGVLIIAGHNLLDAVWPVSEIRELNHPLWVALHGRMSLELGPYRLRFAYPVLPWIGVMLAGFGSAGVFRLPAERRTSILTLAGIGLIAGFTVIRALDVYGDPQPWHSFADMPFVMAFLNTAKYPPSLLYLMMTLGPAAIVCAYADRLRGWFADTLVMFGRVPFAFYVVHLYVLHAFSVALGIAQGFPIGRFLGPSAMFPKEGFGLPLPGVYVVWILVVALLYPICRWMADLKARRTDWWLSYL